MTSTTEQPRHVIFTPTLITQALDAAIEVLHQWSDNINEHHADACHYLQASTEPLQPELRKAVLSQINQALSYLEVETGGHICYGESDEEKRQAFLAYFDEEQSQEFEQFKAQLPAAAAHLEALRNGQYSSDIVAETYPILSKLHNKGDTPDMHHDADKQLVALLLLKRLINADYDEISLETESGGSNTQNVTNHPCLLVDASDIAPDILQSAIHLLNQAIDDVLDPATTLNENAIINTSSGTPPEILAIFPFARSDTDPGQFKDKLIENHHQITQQIRSRAHHMENTPYQTPH